MQRERFRKGVWTVGGLLLLSLAGCGGAKTQPVTGKITYADGTPMPGKGQITFNPMDPGNKHSARGMIAEDGTFTMGTFDDTDGVPEGTYKVSIQPTMPRNIDRPPPGWPPINKKYQYPAKSGLEYTVKPGRNEYKVTVEK